MAEPSVDPDADRPAAPRLTTKTMFVLGSMNVIDCINVTLLSPYVDEMVSEFMQLSPEDPRVGHVVGLLVGVYSLCEVVFSVLWGMLSDRIGRKPTLLIGLAGSAVAPVIFGLGRSLPVVFAARILDGFFCGNGGVTRTFLGELADESNEHKAFGFLALCFSVGLLIGPMLGGQLVHPVRLAPSLFTGTIFDTYPYLLPNLTYATFAAIAWVIGAAFLPETLPQSQRRGLCGARARQPEFQRETSWTSQRQTSWTGTDPAGAPQSYPMQPDELERKPQGCGTRLRCYPRTTVLVIISYCALAGCNAAAGQLFVIMVSYPEDKGGFGFGPSQIGLVQNAGALGLLLMQLFIYPRFSKSVGFFKTFVVGWLIFAFVWSLFPLYAVFADTARFGTRLRYVGLCFMHFFGSFGAGMCFPTAFALLNRAAQGEHRGVVNSLANSCGAVCRGIFPPIAAVVLGWGAKSGIAGGKYFALHGDLALCGAILVLASGGLREATGMTVRKAASQGVQMTVQAKDPHAGSKATPLIEQ